MTTPIPDDDDDDDEMITMKTSIPNYTKTNQTMMMKMTMMTTMMRTMTDGMMASGKIVLC